MCRSNSETQMVSLIFKNVGLVLALDRVSTLKELGSVSLPAGLVVALISKRWHDLHEPPYSCRWKSRNSSVVNASNAWPIKPDWDLGTMYGTVVVVCTFDQEVGTAGEGGSLVLTIGYSDGYCTHPFRSRQHAFQLSWVCSDNHIQMLACIASSMLSHQQSHSEAGPQCKFYDFVATTTFRCWRVLQILWFCSNITFRCWPALQVL